MLKSCREGSLKRISYSIKLNWLLLMRLAAGKRAFSLDCIFKTKAALDVGDKRYRAFGHVVTTCTCRWYRVECLLCVTSVVVLTCRWGSVIGLGCIAWLEGAGWHEWKQCVGPYLFDTSSRWKSRSIASSLLLCIAERLTRLLGELAERELGGSLALLHQNWHGALYASSSMHEWRVVTDAVYVAWPQGSPAVVSVSLLDSCYLWLCSALSAEGHAIYSLSSTELQSHWTSRKVQVAQDKSSTTAFLNKASI